MIRLLRGIVAHAEPAAVVLEVHGVGYRVATLPTLGCALGEPLTLHTHLAVRETALDLYGFGDPRELAFFELLLTIPKVGPKTALQLLSQAPLAVIHKAVLTEDPSYLTKLSSMSKANAEKVVQGLRGKVSEYDTYDSDTTEVTDTLADVVETLIALGYSPKDAREAVRGIPTDVEDTQTRIRMALSFVAR